MVFVILFGSASPGEAQVPPAERTALIDLYNATNGDGWTENTGWLGPEGTECDWFGVSCIPGNPLVMTIELPSNNLVGNIPVTLPVFDNLVWLDLSGNGDLVGPIPAELGELGVNKLDLRNCGLEGNIPDVLCDLTGTLNRLLLSGNELSGSIPTCLWDLQVLMELNLSSNNLTGELPQTLTLDGSLLRELGLAFNGFSGAIPPGIGSASLLESLYLNENLFSGPLPASLGDLTNLTHLSISSNRLVGPVPTEMTQLTSIAPGDFSFAYNGLDTDDPVVDSFLDVHETDWQDGQTLPPLDLVQVESSGSSVTLTWTPRGRVGRSSDYEFHVASVGSDAWRIMDRSPAYGIETWTIHGLDPGSQYRLRIRVVSDKTRELDAYYCRFLPEVESLFSAELTISTSAFDDSWYVSEGATPGGDCLSPATACETIQDAIDLAGAGDRVVVAPGTYSDPVTIANDIHLVGGGPDTVIDTRGIGRAVAVVGGDQVRLEAISIRGGPADTGGAVLIDGATLVQVIRCRIEDSMAERGGGIALVGSATVIIEESRLSGCVATEAGGGISNEGIVILRDSDVEGNSAAQGGGLANFRWRVKIIDSTFQDNEADLGGAIWAERVDLFVESSTLANNRARHGGGVALVIDNGAVGPIEAVFSASTLSGNLGGALLSVPTPVVCLVDSTIVGNTPSPLKDSGVSAWNGVRGKGTVISGNLPLDCNGSILSYGFNADGDGSCGLDSVTDMPGIDAMLSELGRHGGRTPSHTPLPGSPLIDAGNPRAAWDQSGRERLVDGSGDGLASPDIGAVEAVGAVFFDDFESGDARWWAASSGGR